SHTGTLGGMYSMMMLMPDRKSGFVFMISGNGGRARTVLGTSLMRLFTMPMDEMDFEGIADAIYGDGSAPAAAGDANALPDIEDRTPVTPADMAQWLDRKSTRLNSSHVKISYAV